MTETVNTHRTSGDSLTVVLPELNQPANFDIYRRRQELIAKRNAEQDPVKREQLNLLIEQIGSYDRATGMQRMAMAAAIERQMALVADESKSIQRG